MTNQYAASMTGTQNVLYPSTTLPTGRQFQHRNAFHTFKTPDPNVIGWELFVADLSDGIGPMHGGLEHLGGAASSTLDHRFSGSLMLPSLTVNQSPGADLDDAILSHINIFNTFALAYGATANKALWIETDDSDPTLVARTYSPGSNISGLYPIVIGGISSAERLAVPRESGAIQILSDLAATPTVDGTMHTNTNPGWGVIQTPLSILIYANQNIYTLPLTAAIGDAPTSATANIPNGGFAHGSFAIGGGPFRAWWQLPVSNQSIVRRRTISTLSRIASTNWEGTDLQYIDTPQPIWNAAKWRDGFVLIALPGDQESHAIYYWDGRTFEQIPWLSERELTSDWRDYRCGGVYVREGDLFLDVYYNDAPAFSSRHIEWYDPISRRCYQISANYNTGAEEADIAIAAGSNPVSSLSGFFHTILNPTAQASTPFERTFVGPSYMNPFYLLGEDGVGPTVGFAFEPSGTFRSPKLFFPGVMAQMPKVIEEIVFLGAWRGGATDSKVEIEVATYGSSSPWSLSFTGNQTATFYERDRWEKNSCPFPHNESAFIPLQFQVTITQGAATGHTPNALPFVIRGLCFLDRKVRSPLQVWGSAWAH
ncbi:MAG TPA: hypothetical protein VJB57_10400 [Dehalococcoidia bacterium]|nr:hypothetical protein [Dehalococcoidia bacterium]